MDAAARWLIEQRSPRGLGLDALNCLARPALRQPGMAPPAAYAPGEPDDAPPLLLKGTMSETD
jgi:hypothetical protein